MWRPVYENAPVTTSSGVEDMGELGDEVARDQAAEVRRGDCGIGVGAGGRGGGEAGGHALRQERADDPGEGGGGAGGRRVGAPPVPGAARVGKPGLTSVWPSGAATIVSAPLSRTTQRKRSTARRTASRRWASTHFGSSPRSAPSSPECGVSTVGASRSNGSSPCRPSAST